MINKYDKRLINNFRYVKEKPVLSSHHNLIRLHSQLLAHLMFVFYVATKKRLRLVFNFTRKERAGLYEACFEQQQKAGT